MTDYPDEPPPFTRRDAKGLLGRQLLNKAHECARAEDEEAFKEVLRRIGIWDGTSRFEDAVAMFWELCRELRQRGRR